MCMLFSSMINAFRISTSSLVYPQAANWKGGLARETSCTVAVGTCGRPHTLTTPLRVWLGVGRALAAPASPHVASEVRETKDPKSSLTPYYPPPRLGSSHVPSAAVMVAEDWKGLSSEFCWCFLASRVTPRHTRCVCREVTCVEHSRVSRSPGWGHSWLPPARGPWHTQVWARPAEARGSPGRTLPCGRASPGQGRP